MKKIGIIAGIGPASTIEYYQSIIRLYQTKLSTKDYPELILHSINMTEMLAFIGKNDLDGLISFLQKRIQVLEDAGADYALLASNTPHLVFEQVAERVNIPMISIVEEACAYVQKEQIRKVGLLGTKFTMRKGFYQRAGTHYDLEIVVPNEEEQAYVHEKYMGELVFNQILPETKVGLIQVVEGLKRSANIEGIILGGTELPLILQQEDFTGISVFDTTQIHVNSILDKMLED